MRIYTKKELVQGEEVSLVMNIDEEFDEVEFEIVSVSDGRKMMLSESALLTLEAMIAEVRKMRWSE